MRGLSKSQKIGYTIWLVLTILLVGLHYAVISHGYNFAKDWDNRFNSTQTKLYLNEQKQETGFIIIAAGLTFFISIALLIGLCTDKISPRARHVLATFNLMLEFAIAVVISLRASNNSNLRDSSTYENEYSNFKYYYRLSIADAVITFVLEFMYLLIIFFGTLQEVIYLEVTTPVVAEMPPLSNRQL